MGRFDEAFPRVEHALAIFDRMEIYGIALASLLDTKAQILAAQGKTEAADSTFATVMTESHAAPAQARIALYESFESFLRDQNRHTEATEIRNRIEKIMTNVTVSSVVTHVFLDCTDKIQAAIKVDTLSPWIETGCETGATAEAGPRPLPRRPAAAFMVSSL